MSRGLPAACYRLYFQKSNRDATAVTLVQVTMFFITEDEETPSESTLNLLAIGNRLSKAAAHPMVYVHAVRT